MRLLFAVLLLIQPIPRAREWIISQQNENGGWSDGLSERSGPGITVDALIALQNTDPASAEYLHDFANQNATVLHPTLAAKLTMAAVILGEDPRDFAGVDLVETMLTTDSAQFSDSIFEHCLVMIAAYHAGVDMPSDALTFLDNEQDEGGWGFFVDAPPDSNTTAMCIQAKIAQGETDVTGALDFLRDMQNDDAGWTFQKPSDFSTATDAYSTALVIMALHAAGENLADWGHPEERLLEFQRSDGAFGAEDDPLPLFATTAAIPALTNRSLLDIRS